MHRFNSIDDLISLRETVEVEAKLASGQDGKGKLPQDFWATYSAFANTKGGIIVLGLRETRQGYDIVGIPEPERVVKDFFNLVNNPQRVSANLVSDDNVYQLSVDTSILVVIEVPRAPRRLQPVYINGNPISGTYRRLHEGDRLCDPEAVRRMLAEQTQDTRDLKVLRNYDMNDLDLESIKIYRQQIADARGTHPFLDSTGIDFLRQIQAWRRDRETGDEGLTVAGLLMFGKYTSIREELPYYMLDYQERPPISLDTGYTDRLTIDGTWSGNIYDFYRRVYRKLISDLRVPFEIRNGRRKDETPVHQALREAIVNTIVHADYTGRASVLVIKRPDMFGFRNPGLMRISIAQALQGGESDGRNRTLQQMFLLVGAGERAGSGVPRIYQGWAGQHWRPPILRERDEPSDQTLLELRMVDLLPAEAVARLQDLFGERLNDLDANQRLILATAATEGEVSNARMQTICGLHRADITRTFQGLVRDEFLVQSGRTSGTTYHLPGDEIIDANSLFVSPEAVPFQPAPRLPQNLVSPSDRGNLPVNDGSSTRKWGDLARNEVTSEEDTTDAKKSPEAPPYLEQPEDIPSDLLATLSEIAAHFRDAGRVPTIKAREIILAICEERYVSVKVLSFLLGRGEQHLRDRIIYPMFTQGLLARSFPEIPNHPKQGYISVRS